MKTNIKTLIEKIYEVFDSKGFTYEKDKYSTKREYTAPKEELEKAYNEILNGCDSNLKKTLPNYSLNYTYVDWAKCEITYIGTYRVGVRVFVKEVK